jgi:hypothetical protein
VGNDPVEDDERRNALLEALASGSKTLSLRVKGFPGATSSEHVISLGYEVVTGARKAEDVSPEQVTELARFNLKMGLGSEWCPPHLQPRGERDAVIRKIICEKLAPLPQCQEHSDPLDEAAKWMERIAAAADRALQRRLPVRVHKDDEVSLLVSRYIELQSHIYANGEHGVADKRPRGKLLKKERLLQIATGAAKTH